MVQKILVLGAQGQLGKEFSLGMERAGKVYIAPKESDCDITNQDDIINIIDAFHPTTVINCAAYNAVDMAEEAPETAYKINYESVSLIASICAKRGVKLVHYGSDYVFDGTKQGLYTEIDEPNPLNEYGKSKLKGEQAVLAECPDSLVFRLSWVIGPGEQNFLFKLSQWAGKNEVLKISADEVSVPTFTNDIVECTLKSLDLKLTGLFHLTNSGYASRYEIAKSYIKKKGLTNIVIPVPMSEFKTKAVRPKFSAMSNNKLSHALGYTIPDWETGLGLYLIDESR